VADHFGDRIAEAVKNRNTPLVVGLDPVYSRLPKSIINHPQMNDEFDVSSAIDAIMDYSTTVLKIASQMVPAVKINIAYFEKYLWEGIEAYYALISEAEALGIEVIGDVKRGDIGHTAEAYAEAHLVNSELTGFEDTVAPDAITINGFAGSEGIIPFADAAQKQGKGVFVWVRGSNPSSAAIQDFTDANGVKMYEVLADEVGKIASDPKYIGSCGYSNVGMVIGGTSPEETSKLRDKYKNQWILVPGYGSQGASAADCMRFRNPDGLGVLINSSRSIIYAYEKPKYREQFEDNWQKCIEEAITDAKIELTQAAQ
jgi:orotidine-5'-phosphate decarboxylase